MKAHLFAAAVLVSVAACSSQAVAPAPPGALPSEAKAMSAAKATLTPSSRPAPPTAEEATSLYEFDHAFPGQAARLPGLRALLEQERADLRPRLITEAIRA